MLKGIGASQGFGIGKAVVIKDTELDYSSVKYSDAKSEKARLHKAADDFVEETKLQIEQVKQSAGEEEAEILEGHLMMLQDPFMLSQMEDNIDQGAVAESAVDTVCTMFIDMFSGVDDELTRQRASDVKDIKDNLLSLLLGIKRTRLGACRKGFHSVNDKPNQQRKCLRNHNRGRRSYKSQRNSRKGYGHSGGSLRSRCNRKNYRRRSSDCRRLQRKGFA